MSTQELTLRRATSDDAPAIRALVNEAYRPLGEMGLNFTGVSQDEETTRRRMEGRDAWLLYRADELVGTITLRARSPDGDQPHLYVNQMAVRPDLQGRGLGTYLLKFAEREAMRLGLGRVRLDTALPASHLVRFYASRGFAELRRVHWKEKTYESIVMEKRL